MDLLQWWCDHWRCAFQENNGFIKCESVIASVAPAWCSSRGRPTRCSRRHQCINGRECDAGFGAGECGSNSRQSDETARRWLWFYIWREYRVAQQWINTRPKSFKISIGSMSTDPFVVPTYKKPSQWLYIRSPAGDCGILNSSFANQNPIYGPTPAMLGPVLDTYSMPWLYGAIRYEWVHEHRCESRS